MKMPKLNITVSQFVDKVCLLQNVKIQIWAGSLKYFDGSQKSHWCWRIVFLKMSPKAWIISSKLILVILTWLKWTFHTLQLKNLWKILIKTYWNVIPNNAMILIQGIFIIFFFVSFRKLYHLPSDLSNFSWQFWQDSFNQNCFNIWSFINWKEKLCYQKIVFVQLQC